MRTLETVASAGSRYLSRGRKLPFRSAANVILLYIGPESFHGPEMSPSTRLRVFFAMENHGQTAAFILLQELTPTVLHCSGKSLDPFRLSDLNAGAGTI